MNDEEFFQAIVAAPEARTLRLGYADWLEERGDPGFPPVSPGHSLAFSAGQCEMGESS
jgi:uncharacterized protein (TIGR02996 family)